MRRTSAITDYDPPRIGRDKSPAPGDSPGMAATTRVKKPASATKRTNTPAVSKGAAGVAAGSPFREDAHEWDKMAVAVYVCDKISSSSKSIGSILKEGFDGHELPGYSTFARWIAEEPEDAGPDSIREMYARAKEAQADWMAEELAELHNKAWVPAFDAEGNLMRTKTGEPLMVVDKSSAALVRLEADNKKWLMAKLKPKRYGEKQTTEMTGPGGGAIVVESHVTLHKAPERSDG